MGHHVKRVKGVAYYGHDRNRYIDLRQGQPFGLLTWTLVHVPIINIRLTINPKAPKDAKTREYQTSPDFHKVRCFKGIA